jgi:hypothetical protein
MLQRHNTANGPKGANEQQALVEDRMVILGDGRSAQDLAVRQKKPPSQHLSTTVPPILASESKGDPTDCL